VRKYVVTRTDAQCRAGFGVRRLVVLLRTNSLHDGRYGLGKIAQLSP